MFESPVLLVCLLLPSAPDEEEDRGCLQRSEGLIEWASCEFLGLESPSTPAPFSLSASWTADFSRVLRGGLRRRSAARSLWQLEIEADLDEAFGTGAGRLFAVGQHLVGRDGSRDSGDFQIYSNIDAEAQTQVAALGWECGWLDERISLKIGKFDANDDFAASEPGAAFLHSSPGFSPTIFLFPSYPDPAFGARLRAGHDHAGLSLGAFSSEDDAPTSGRRGLRVSGNAVFAIAEAELRWAFRGARDGRAVLGAWHHDGDQLARFDGGRERGTEGSYALVDQVLHCEELGEGVHRCWSAFVQAGRADPDLSEVEHHLGAGLLVEGPCACRPHDQLGFSVNWVRFSEAPGSGLGGQETAYEVFWRCQLTPFFALTPDLQLLDDPGGRGGPSDAVVATLRVELVF